MKLCWLKDKWFLWYTLHNDKTSRMLKNIFLTFFDLKTKSFKIAHAQLCYSYKTSIYSTVQTSIYSTVHVYSFHQTLIKLCLRTNRGISIYHINFVCSRYDNSKVLNQRFYFWPLLGLWRNAPKSQLNGYTVLWSRHWIRRKGEEYKRTLCFLLYSKNVWW